MQLSRSRAAALAAAPVLLLGAALAVPGVSAQDPTSTQMTFTELEQGATFTHVRHRKHAPRRANSAGDVIVFTSPLADASGARVGTLSGACVTTTGARNFMKSAANCNGTAELPYGTLTFQMLLRPGAQRTEGAITGGTRAYAGARGTVVSETLDDGRTQDTVNLIR